MASHQRIADLSGNVCEWTTTLWGQSGATALASPTRHDQQMAAKTYQDGSGRRILRGGSWRDFSIYARVSSRNRYSPGLRGSFSGFRCVVRRPHLNDPVHCSSCTQRYAEYITSSRVGLPH